MVNFRWYYLAACDTNFWGVILVVDLIYTKLFMIIKTLVLGLSRAVKLHGLNQPDIHGHYSALKQPLSKSGII